jgi:hypothetical protein
MKLTTALTASLLLTAPLIGAQAQSPDGFAPTASNKNLMYEVTITNITRGSLFTPILVVSHRPGVKLFKLGDPASRQLAALAEGGDIGQLADMLSLDSHVVGIGDSGGPLPAGQSVTVRVPAGNANQISLAAMILPTNDGFIALNGVAIPRSGSQTFMVNGYDAGSEPNDESCANIPGPLPDTPKCEGDGEGISLNVNGEGFVHVHAGIHGIGDLDPAVYDWRNPMAVVTVQKVR